jgi:hypothetical protein
MVARDRVRGTAAAALVALVLIAATACGDDGTDSSSPSSPTVASGTSSASAEDSAAPSPTPEAGTPVDPDRFVSMFTAAFEQATTAHLTMSINGEGRSMEAEGDIDYSSDPPNVAMRLNSDQFGDGTEVRVVDGVMYLKTSMLGDKFVRTDLSGPDNPLGEQFAGAFDLRKVLDGFESRVRSVTLVGVEEVDGERLRRYRVTMDGSADASEPSGSTAAEPPEDLAYDMWFDADGFFRRMEADRGPDDGAMTVMLSEWGEPVSIEAPPSRDVTGRPGGS